MMTDSRAIRRSRLYVSAAADQRPQQSLPVLLLLLFLCLETLISPSNALRCECNDETPLSNCRFDNWKCETSPDYGGKCFAKMSIKNGAVVRDEGCVYTRWNPTFCDASRTTQTYAVGCCDHSDDCNGDINLQFLSSAVLQPTPSVDGSGSALFPSPTPNVVQCECTGNYCPQPTCNTTIACFKKISSVSGTVEVESGCWTNENNGVKLCNQSLPNLAFECCSDYDMCNSDLSVVLPTPSTTTTPSPDTPSSSETKDPPSHSEPTVSPTDSKLRCKCSRSVCQDKDWCNTDYKCYKDVRAQSSTAIRTTYGCVESSFPSGINICAGIEDREDHKTACCDDSDLCNTDLVVQLPHVKPEPSKPPLKPTSLPNVNDPTASQDSDNDNVYIILSTVVVLVTVIVIVALFGTVGVVMFYLRYQRAKAQVTSVEHLTPSGVKKLSNGSINCPVTQISSHGKEHTDLDYIVQYRV